MIPSRQEIVSSLFGAWRLLFYDAEALRHFNLSVEGFWRSFFAAAFGLPYFLVILDWPSAEEGEQITLGWVGVSVLAYVLSWTLFPLLCAFLTRTLDLGQNYVAYITAYNWGGALIPQPLLILVLLFHAGMLTQEALGMFQLVFFVATMWYGWSICRIALGAGAVTACAFVILANLLDILIAVWLLAPGLS